MKRTRFGTLLLAAGWFCFAIGFALGTLAPTFLGAVMVALVATARAPRGDPHVTRTVPQRAFAGRPFEVETRVQGHASEPVFADDPPPVGLVQLGQTVDATRGLCVIRTTLRGDDPGAYAWTSATVRVQDRWGIVQDEVVVPAEHHVDVRPDARSFMAGAKAHAHVDQSRKPSKAGEVQPEVERLRAFHPGDRLRDVDWAHSSKLGELLTRELLRDDFRPLMLVIQLSGSMLRRGRPPKAATATRAALAVLGAARAAGIPVGVVTFDERGVDGYARCAADTSAATAVLLAAVDRHGARAPTAAPGIPPHYAGLAPTQEARGFLAATGALRGDTSGATPVEAAVTAVHRATSSASHVIAFFDVEEDPDAGVAFLRGVARRQHRVLIAAPKTGAHHYRRQDANAAVITKLDAWRSNRELLRAVCDRQGAQFVSLSPGLPADELKAVVGFA